MNAPQRSEAWHQARIGRVTGSIVGAILDLSPYMTRADALRSMIRAYHGAPNEFTGNAATQWGTAMEAGAIAEFEMETGLSVEPMPFVPFEDWLGASPDGGVSDGRGLEVKCPYGIRSDPEPVFKTLDAQPHYRAQVMVEMYCCGWSELHFWQWTPHGRNHDVIERDYDWLATNIPALKQFHAEYLSELDNPDHLQPLRVTIDTPAAHLMVQEWDQLVEAEERAKERRKDLLAEMVALAGDRNALISGRKLTLTTRAGSVSYGKALKELAPGADLSKWTGKPSSFWGLK